MSDGMTRNPMYECPSDTEPYYSIVCHNETAAFYWSDKGWKNDERLAQYFTDKLDAIFVMTSLRPHQPGMEIDLLTHEEQS